MYMQYYCKQPDTLRKQRIALGIVCIGVFICLLFLLSLYYLQQTSRLDYKLWDINTVTVADFTAETYITQRMWEEFEKKHAVRGGLTIKLFE